MKFPVSLVYDLTENLPPILAGVLPKLQTRNHFQNKNTLTL